MTSKQVIVQELFKARSQSKIQALLNQAPTLVLTQLIDSQGNNLLHQLAFQGQTELIRFYIKRHKHQLTRNSVGSDCTSAHSIAEWINQANHKGFTSLLYASYSGHLPTIHFLQGQQANLALRTNSGLNPLHLAAQRNMVLPFIYLRGRVDLNQIDSVNSTALHWASYMNSQDVVSYILANKQYIQIDKQDAQGHTALALAVVYGNTRIVRRLLIAGANRNVTNIQGKKPIDLARQNSFKGITRMLSQDYTCFDMIKFYCNVKIEYKPKKRNMKIPFLFILSFILNVTIINMFLVFPNEYVFYGQAALFALTFIIYFSLLIQRKTNQPSSWQQILQTHQNNISKVCYTCCKKYPRRGHHCDVCGVCVAQYDHHCTWINNCVGKFNLKRFIFFITLLLPTLLLTGTASVLGSLILFEKDPKLFQEWVSLRHYSQENIQYYGLLALFFVNQVTSLFFFPVLMLFIVQIKNLLVNKTTYQKMREPKVQDEAEITRKISKRNKISLTNCGVMCGDTKGSFTTNRQSFMDILTTQKFASAHIDDQFQQPLLK